MLMKRLGFLEHRRITPVPVLSVSSHEDVHPIHAAKVYSQSAPTSPRGGSGWYLPLSPALSTCESDLDHRVSLGGSPTHELDAFENVSLGDTSNHNRVTTTATAPPMQPLWITPTGNDGSAGPLPMTWVCVSLMLHSESIILIL